jgi:hypothetical protein
VKRDDGEPRDAASRLARQRLSVLELAAELGNAAATAAAIPALRLDDRRSPDAMPDQGLAWRRLGV